MKRIIENFQAECDVQDWKKEIKRIIKEVKDKKRAQIILNLFTLLFIFIYINSTGSDNSNTSSEGGYNLFYRIELILLLAIYIYIIIETSEYYKLELKKINSKSENDKVIEKVREISEIRWPLSGCIFGPSFIVILIATYVFDKCPPKYYGFLFITFFYLICTINLHNPKFSDSGLNGYFQKKVNNCKIFDLDIIYGNEFNYEFKIIPSNCSRNIGFLGNLFLYILIFIFAIISFLVFVYQFFYSEKS